VKKLQGLEIGARRRHRGRAGERDTGKQPHGRADEIWSMTHHSVLPDFLICRSGRISDRSDSRKQFAGIKLKTQPKSDLFGGLFRQAVFPQFSRAIRKRGRIRPSPCCGPTARR
jgi:hypothetical protein